MKQTILNILANDDFLKRTPSSLAKELGYQTKEEFTSFMKVLNQLEEELVVIRNDKDEYYLPTQKNMVIGILSINKKGFGFVRLEDENLEDIFISKESLKGAFDKDTVLAQIEEQQKGNRKEGKILRVIKRGKTRIVGELRQGNRDCYVESTVLGLDKRIYIDKGHLHGATVGHVVAVEIKVYKPLVKGTVVDIIGHKSDPGVDILSVVSDHGVDIAFPKEVYKQIDYIQDEVLEADLVGRLDLRKEVIVTIDGDDAKDLDDAISLTINENGNYYLGVHIADVSHYVSEDSPLDKEAVERGTSIYLVDRVIPMLPHKLSNGICSLNPHVDRLTMSCFMEIDKTGEVIDYKIDQSVIHSTERMTYNNVNKILAGDKEMTKQYQHVQDLFFLMQELASILQNKREQRGAIDFDVKEAKVLVNKKGKPTDVVLRERGISDRIIESFMLQANETVAKHFCLFDKPFIYRVHEHPKLSKLQQFTGIAKTMGYEIEGSLEDIEPMQLRKLIESSRDKEEHDVITTLLLRCMQKAAYDENCLGHYGLADEYYTHFTSPIRRYPDLLVHRLIRTYLVQNKLDNETLNHFNEVVPILAKKSSERERLAITIEREVEDMKKAEFMEQYINKEFDGIISSVTSFGFFVELENTIEGLVHVLDLSDDFYFYDEKKLQFIGQRTGKHFGLSDKVRVRVSGASKKERNIDFVIVGMKPNKSRRKVVIKTDKKANNSYRNKKNKHQRNNDGKRQDRRSIIKKGKHSRRK